MSTSAAVTVPSDTPTLPNLFESLVTASPPPVREPPVAPAAAKNVARRDTLLEPVEWIVSFDDDETAVVPPPEPSAEALDLDDDALEVEVAVENLKSGIRRLVGAPPPLPRASAKAPAPAPSAAPTLRVVAPPRSRFWGDSRDEF